MSCEKKIKIDPQETYESALRYPEDPTYKPVPPVTVIRFKAIPTGVFGPQTLLRILELNGEAEKAEKAAAAAAAAANKKEE